MWWEIIKQMVQSQVAAEATKDMEGPAKAMAKAKLGGAQTEADLTGSQDIANIKGLKEYGTEQLQTRGLGSLGSDEIIQQQLENSAKQAMVGNQGITPQVAQAIQQKAQLQQPQGPFGFAQGVGHGFIGQPSKVDDPSVWWQLGQTLGQVGRSRAGAPTGDTTPLETQQSEAQLDMLKTQLGLRKKVLDIKGKTLSNKKLQRQLESDLAGLPVGMRQEIRAIAYNLERGKMVSSSYFGRPMVTEVKTREEATEAITAKGHDPNLPIYQELLKKFGGEKTQQIDDNIYNTTGYDW